MALTELTALLDDPIEVSSPITTGRRPEHLFLAEDWTLVYVSSDAADFSFSTVRLSVGNGWRMRRIAIRSVDRMHLDGTLAIRTRVGSLYSPSDIHIQKCPNDVPKWGRKRLIRLDPSDFVISESADGEVIIV
ncbi:MAG TPA: hypothetical protein VMR34_06060 [Candidatus Saccharimonadales bacterium]|nr:hypothetical protein [Candidatus Saccharimonadales bacterium]